MSNKNLYQREGAPEVIDAKYGYVARCGQIWPPKDATPEYSAYYGYDIPLRSPNPTEVKLPELEGNEIVFLDIVSRAIIRIRHTDSGQEETVIGRELGVGPRLYVAGTNPDILLPITDIGPDNVTHHLEVVMNKLLAVRGPQEKRFRSAGEDLARCIGHLTVTS
jgi:hypothetical protein